MTNPYYYRIKDKVTGRYYVGCRYSAGCDPKEFWVSYFTSSETIWSLIEESGIERFEVQRVIPKKDSYSYETKVLRRVDGRNNPLLYNKHNNDFQNGFGLECYSKLMIEKYGVDHPTKVPEIRERIVTKMTKTRNSEEWKDTKGVEWSQSISRTLKDRAKREDWNEIDKDRRKKISSWVNDSDNQRNRLDALKDTLQSEHYQNTVEPERVEKVRQANLDSNKRDIVLEIREIKDNLNYKVKNRLTKELNIKQGWYRKPEKDLLVLKERIMVFLDDEN